MVRRAFIFSAVLSLVMIGNASARDMDCSDFVYQQDAQEYFVSHGGSASNNFDLLDADHDGIACDLLPRRTSSASPVPSELAESGGISTGWLLAGFAIAAGGAWYYAAEVRGPGNQRIKLPANLPYNTKTMPYERYLQTPEWAAIRRMALDRDGNKCTQCGSTTVLQAHHVTYKRRGHEKLKDLKTLCKNCHEQTHGKRRG